MSAETEISPASKDPEPPNRLSAVVFGVLPALVVLLGALVGYQSWRDWSDRGAAAAAAESVEAAREATSAILSYHADSADKELNEARARLTAPFLNDFTTLINDVVIPGARQKKISASIEVPAASTVTATPNHAVALVFVDQTTTVGDGVPTLTASSIRVTLDKVDGKWLVSGFDPV